MGTRGVTPLGSGREPDRSRREHRRTRPVQSSPTRKPCRSSPRDGGMASLSRSESDSPASAGSSSAPSADGRIVEPTCGGACSPRSTRGRDDRGQERVRGQLRRAGKGTNMSSQNNRIIGRVLLVVGIVSASCRHRWCSRAGSIGGPDGSAGSPGRQPLRHGARRRSERAVWHAEQFRTVECRTISSGERWVPWLFWITDDAAGNVYPPGYGPSRPARIDDFLASSTP